MGLLSSIVGSNKSKSTTAANTNNIGFSDVSGPAIYGSGNKITDLGAIAAGVGTAKESLRIAGNTVVEINNLAGRALDAQRFLSETALIQNSDTNRNALDFAGDAFDSAIHFVGDITTQQTGAVKDIAKQQAADLAGFVRETNASTETTITNAAKWAVGVIAAAWVGNAFLMRMKRA